MATEIERKFLIDVDKLKQYCQSQPWAWNIPVIEIEQAFILSRADASVRIRVSSDPKRSPETVARLSDEWQIPRQQLCVKIGKGPIRTEFEFEMSEDLEVLEEIMSQYPSTHKFRSLIPVGKRIWEVDQFINEHDGLYLAEIELDSLEEEIELPDWLGEEVTWNAEYYNCNLATKGK